MMERGANTEHFDAIVIGTGQGGKPLALALAEAGHKTAVIERAAVGGTCVNYGCTPTKTMVASARIAWLARRAADFGVDAGPVRVNMQIVRQRKRSLVEMFRSSGEKSIEQTENLELIRGEASFIDAKSLQVQLGSGSARYLTAKRIFINTGLQPVRPSIDGLDDVRTLDNTTVMELGEVPQHLLVLGGGYIGLEFAQMFRRFGSKVTIINRGEQLLKQEDPDIAEEIANILQEDGIDVLLSTSARKVREDSEGALHLEIDASDGPRTVTGTHLLVAAGRAPATEALRLDAAGIETDEKGFVRVSARLETNVSGVFAIGDVKGGPAFTHVSYNDYMVLKANLLDGGDLSIEGRPILYTVFMDPELGRVGLTEREARAEGLNVLVARLPMSYVARALEMDETRGVMKAIVDADSKKILGAAILGVHGGEVMSMIQIAMMGGLPYTALRDGMFAHPLFAEALNSLFASFED